MNLKQTTKSKTITLQNANSYWFLNKAKAFSALHRRADDSDENFLNRNSIFVTLTFSKKKLFRRKLELNEIVDDISVIHNDVKIIYCSLIRAIFDKMNAWKKDDFPVFFAWIDFNSKFREFIAEEEVENLHIHGIMVTTDATNDNIFQWFSSKLALYKTFGWLTTDNIKAERLDLSKGSLSDLAKYASKGARIIGNSKIPLSDVMIFPYHLHDHRPDRLPSSTHNYAVEEWTRKHVLPSKRTTENEADRLADHRPLTTDQIAKKASVIVSITTSHSKKMEHIKQRQKWKIRPEHDFIRSPPKAE